MWNYSMKFRKKPVISAIVEAEQYKPGMEEGFETRYRDIKKPHCTRDIQFSPKEIPVQVPYIYFNNEKKFIRSDDWIIKYQNGRKTIMRNKEFITTYEKAEGQNEY
jgi:hypothetical protein